MTIYQFFAATKNANSEFWWGYFNIQYKHNIFVLTRYFPAKRNLSKKREIQLTEKTQAFGCHKNLQLFTYGENNVIYVSAE